MIQPDNLDADMRPGKQISEKMRELLAKEREYAKARLAKDMRMSLKEFDEFQLQLAQEPDKHKRFEIVRQAKRRANEMDTGGEAPGIGDS